MLAQALAKLGQYHEIWIALNGLFPDAVEHLRKKFEGLVPSERIVVWHAPGPVAACDPANAWRRETAELLREAFITGLKPDIVHVASLFEGWADNCVTSVGKSSERVPVAVTVYDLIPLLYKDVYLSEPQVRAWYYQKLQWLKNAELWLAISEHTRQDVIEQLGLPEDRVVNISAGRDPRFRPIEIDPAAEASLRARYRLNRPFVLYVGGIEPRKNIEGLLKAYALLPKDLRERHQLVVVCDIQELERRRLYELARREGLHQGDVVFPGFVSDEVLIALYNLCKLFVFPSFYEGFGLPPLEAMACGAPVIASNTSSLPEVVGWEKALFDPKRPEAIAEKMQEALTDEVFREALKRHGLEQAKRFSWEESARRALKAFEALHAEQSKAGAKAPFSSARSRKPSLAYLSPLPPARTGIADYSQELLPELARYYQIELIIDQPEVSDPWLTANFPIRTVEWFEKHADRYDRILYHFGNSEFHKHMFRLLQRHPGVVVLHDFYLSGVLHWMDHIGYTPGVFHAELYRAHGWGALAECLESGEEAAVWKYPCNLSVIQRAEGVIVHSHYATELAARWYGKGIARDWRVIPHLRRLPIKSDRAAARAQLGLGSDDFLICSFGFIAKTKLSEAILEGWLRSRLARDPRCRLVFVGHSFEPELEAKLRESAKRAGVSE
ncbi:MAG: glycosyltransferase, partial [Candidatus Bipolaricaulaceae bacterium]